MNFFRKPKRKIVIVGGGNAAHVFIARCGHLGLPCDWLSVLPEEAARLRAANGEKGGITATNTMTGETWFGRPDKISDDPAEIIPGAGIIIMTLPVFAQESVLKKIEPYLEEGSSFGGIPGGACLDLLIYSIFGAERTKKCTLFGTRTLPWACRITEYGKSVSIFGTKKSDHIVISPKSADYIVAEIQHIVGENHQYIKADNFLFLSFTMPWHPCFMYGMFSEWDGTTPFTQAPEFYSSISLETASLISQASDEIIGLRDHIVEIFPTINLQDVIHVKEWMQMAYGSSPRKIDLGEFHSMIANNPAYQGLLFPMKAAEGGYVPDYTSRYLTEDIPCVFLVYKGLSEMVGYQIPKTEMVIQWSQHVMGKDYIGNGIFSGRNISESRAPQRFGFDDFQTFVETMGYN